MAVKFFSVEHKSGEGAVKVNQVTKLNILATPEEPHVTTIDIPFDNKFSKLPIEVLKMIGGKESIVEVLANFDNADKTDFIRSPYIEFDGTMHLKTDYEFQATKTNEETDIYSFDLNNLNIFADKIISIDCYGVMEE